MRAWRNGAGTTLMLAAVAASAVLCAWSYQRAVQLDALPVAGRTGAALEVPRIVRPTGEPPEALVAALESAPFHPERRRPAGRFRLPGDAVPVAAAPPPATDPDAPPLQVQLFGTVVAPGGRSFALVQLGAEPPKLVRIGEKIGDLTLTQVGQRRAVFLSAAGARVEVHVQRIGS
ncbi:MAG TPA: hypothetical protein VHG28_04645 [Longimicrobiaceae bacterium]|nr:hypothetical protein [Longimicrobiaceae bacterium]